MTHPYQLFNNALSPFYGGGKRKREGNSDGNLPLHDGDVQTIEDVDEIPVGEKGEGDKSEKVDDSAMELENVDVVEDEETGESNKSEKEQVDDQNGGGGGGLTDSESDSEWEDVEEAEADEENNRIPRKRKR